MFDGKFEVHDYLKSDLDTQHYLYAVSILLFSVRFSVQIQCSFSVIKNISVS